MLVPAIGSARCSGLCRQHSLCSHVESVFDCHRSPSPSQCLFRREASCRCRTIRQGPITLEFSLLFDLFKVCITRIASSVNFVKEIDELLKIYFVIWLYASYLNHRYIENGQIFDLLTVKFLIRYCFIKQREHCFEVFWTDIAFSKGISLAKKGTYFSRSNIEKAKTR